MSTVSDIFTQIINVLGEVFKAIMTVLPKVISFILWVLCAIIILPCVFIAGNIYPAWVDWGKEI